mmetsp:Transcript_3755/g.9443  ORF Transcript_3755/g.9443 Transcript_3755/m.9443 type:complete len:299 (+) Transcript_3755:90-986(+)
MSQAVWIATVAVTAAWSAAGSMAPGPAQLPPVAIAPGVNMPMVSIGHPDDGCTHGRGPGCAAAALNMTAMWLRIGGRGIDTAQAYDNQPQVGQAIHEAIAAGIVNRSDVFVTTKINPEPCTADAALAAVKSDAQQLGLAQLDLVLHHFPCDSDDENKAVWAGLADAKAQGLTRAIGVSHYTQETLEGIASLGKGTPVVNQCELCIGQHDDATIAYCKSKGITYQAYGALRSVDLSNPTLEAVATAHNVSTAQVALRWVTQLGSPLAVSPGLNQQYAIEDLRLAVFSLTPAEMAKLSAI